MGVAVAVVERYQNATLRTGWSKDYSWPYFYIVGFPKTFRSFSSRAGGRNNAGGGGILGTSPVSSSSPPNGGGNPSLSAGGQPQFVQVEVSSQDDPQFIVYTE